jgi:purine nucleosidase
MTQPSGGRPIVLDTDIGTDVDDAIALALILASPELELRAVTTVAGDTYMRARIAAKLLALAGRPDVPVAAGVREPVLRQRSFLWLGHEGAGIVEPDERLRRSDRHAVDLLIETLRRERAEVVTIGPLSNLAVAIMKEPAVIEAIPHLTAMGGAIGRHGRQMFEYNLASDAEAALVVLSAGIPTTLVPLDVTMRVAMTGEHLAALRRSTPLQDRLCAAIEIWAPLQRQFLEAEPGFDSRTVSLLHDPLTVAALLEPSLVSFEPLRLRPQIAGGLFRLQPDPTAPEIRVAVAVDAPRAVAFILERLARLG